jgi:hypothetical protein
MILQIYLKKAIFLFEKTILFLKIAVIMETRTFFTDNVLSLSQK